jgi:hypothetical protein
MTLTRDHFNQVEAAENAFSPGVETLGSSTTPAEAG